MVKKKVEVVQKKVELELVVLVVVNKVLKLGPLVDVSHHQATHQPPEHTPTMAEFFLSCHSFFEE